MCRDCLVTVRPERGRTCLETGAFVLNYAGCYACKQRSGIQSVNREASEDEQDNGDYEETVTFHHACAVCGHAIAEHYYTFTVAHPPHIAGAVQQDYMMDCVLCGRAADTSHAVNDVAAHTHPPHHHQLAVTQVRAAHGLPHASSQQQHATMRQLIGRMEIVSVVVHTAAPSAAGSQKADVQDDEWT